MVLEYLSFLKYDVPFTFTDQILTHLFRALYNLIDWRRIVLFGAITKCLLQMLWNMTLFFFYLRNFHKAKFLHRNFLLSYSISTLIFDVCHLECCFIWTPEERYMDIYSKPECSVFACIPSSYMSNTSNTTTNGVNLGRDYLFDWPTGGRSARGTCLKTVIITAILQL